MGVCQWLRVEFVVSFEMHCGHWDAMGMGLGWIPGFVGQGRLYYVFRTRKLTSLMEYVMALFFFRLTLWHLVMDHNQLIIQVHKESTNLGNVLGLV